MRRRFAPFPLLALVACGGDMAPPPPPLGAPIEAPKNTWTWIDFPDSACDDGSPTGVAVNLTDGKNVLFYFEGGGACWDYGTCFQLHTAAQGPFGKPEFDARAQTFGSSIFDRSLGGSPFADWSFVYVPYCTGDLHAGDNVAAYSTGGQPAKMFHHVGHANAAAYLKRLGATFAKPNKVVVSGSSAGGFGAFFNYDSVRAYFPGAKMYLVDDSGPPLEQSAFPSGFIDAWWANWRLDKLLDPLCGQSCHDDLSVGGVHALVKKYPRDRLALLSSLQDQTIRGFAVLTGSGFEKALRMAATDLFDPSPNFRYFFVDGQTHTMLGHPTDFTSKGTPLLGWLSAEVTDGAWQSTTP